MRFGVSSSGRTWVSFGPFGFAVLLAWWLATAAIWLVLMLVIVWPVRGLWWLSLHAVRGGTAAVTAIRGRNVQRQQAHS